MFQSINPYTQQVIATYEEMSNAAIDNCLLNAEKAFAVWSKYTFQQRATTIKNIAAILLRDKEALALLITNEMGKVLAESKAEIEKCALACEYYADNAEQFLKDEQHKIGFYKSYVTYEPIGAVLGIMPWNFPFWQVLRYVIPTLMAGNVTLLKHAPNVFGCAKELEAIFIEAGAIKGVFQSLIVDTPVVEKIIKHDILQAVTLTGSERAGSSVASLAGKYIKKSALELGGSDAFIVLSDAHMKSAAATALQSRMQNAGQSCIGAKRFIVLQSAMNDFIQELNTQIKNIHQGNPLDNKTTIGPMARIDLVNNLFNQMRLSIKQGAVLEYGGEISNCNYQPTILLNVKEGMPAFEQETFGPLATIITVANEEEAIVVANNTQYGLGGSIWSNDIDKAESLGRKLQCGSVFINSLVKSMPQLPFGGIKKSGYGRELGRNGLFEFMNVKTVVVNK